jgi:fucose 4-O-acetylase-like acetyltransferase
MRNYKIDNIKAFLIILVVFGHMLELVDMGGLYRVIYTVHMPVFIFVSGYFARFNGKKLVRGMILPYVAFQLLYIVFDMAVIDADMDWSKVQFSKPHWLMWFMLVMILYHLLIPFIESFENIWLVFAVTCVLSLLAGFDANIGYFMSLGRFFTFMPYFVLGMAFRKHGIDNAVGKKLWRVIVVVIAIFACVCIWIYGDGVIGRNALYGALSYAKGGYTVGIKALLLIIGVNWCFVFMWTFPNIKIPVISTIGQNTLAVYLLHGFVKEYLKMYLAQNNMEMTVADALGISCVIVVLLGNGYVGKAFRRVTR